MNLPLSIFALLFAPLSRGSQKHLKSEDLIDFLGRECSNATIFPSSRHEITEADRKFCKWAESDNGGKVKRGGGVLSGGSWGRLRSSEKRKRYVDLLCPLVTSSNLKPSCNSVWGDELVEHWKERGQRAKCISPNGHEVMRCHRSAGELSTQCTLKDAIVDFSVMPLYASDGKKLNSTVFPHGKLLKYWLEFMVLSSNVIAGLLL